MPAPSPIGRARPGSTKRSLVGRSRAHVIPFSLDPGPIARPRLLASSIAARASAYVLGGPGGAAAPTTALTQYAFDGSRWTAYRSAVENTSNFGPSGLHSSDPISTTAMPVVTAESLSSLDGFVSPWWADLDSDETEVGAVVEFFLGGGDLVLLQDDSTHDAIGTALGLPIGANSDGSVSNGSAPLFDGPFGGAANVTPFGHHGQLLPGDVTDRRGRVVATNASGQVTAAYWPRGAYAPGAGALLIVTDVDMWTTQATYAPFDDNARFALNGTALLRLAPAYVVGGPAGSLAPGSGDWSWDGSFVAPFRTAVEHLENFGPGSSASVALETADLQAVDAADLAGVDAFVSSWWDDGETSPAQTAAVVEFFRAGGDLLLLQDDSSHDAIGEALGIPTAGSSDGSPSNGGAPLFEGRFGRASNVVQTGTTGSLNPADVAARRGTIAATNAAGQVTAAIWNRGDYAPGAGRLVILADVDMLSSRAAEYRPLDDNGRFALNAMGFLAATRAFTIGGPGIGLTTPNFGYSWEQPFYLAEYRKAVENPAFFGPGGRVWPRAITTVELPRVTSASLRQVDAFVSPWWRDSDISAAEAEAVRQFFLNGGNLVLLQDDASHDAIGALLGLPTSPSDGSPSNGGTPLFTGPFGSTLSLSQAGDTGRLDAGQVAASGGTVAGTNWSGEITAAVWEAGDYAVGAGRMLIVTDIDMWATTQATYAPLNDLGTFALNGTAFLRGPSILAGPQAGLMPASGDWVWSPSGLYLGGYRAAVESPVYFGPGGIVRVPIETRDLAVIDRAALEEVDTFIAPFWSDADAAPSQVAAVIDHFRAGGNLILLQDSNSYDSIGEALQLPTLPGAGTASNGGAPLFDGPFGTASNVTQSGFVGSLNFFSVLFSGGQIAATNSAGEVTAAYWDYGRYAPGAGRLLILSDVDMWATTRAIYGPLNANGTFALNGTAIAAPEPALGALVATGGMMLAGLARRRRSRG